MKIATLVMVFAVMAELQAAATVYPVPSGIALNPDFSVEINDGSGFVPVPVQDIVDSCFVHFEMNGPVQMRITVSENVEWHQISPARLNIASEVDENVITFTLTEPGQLIVLVNDGAGNHTTGLDGLLIFAEQPETDVPSLSSPNVINIMSYGVDNTGGTVETAKIQQAFNDHAGTGNIIYFPTGIYKSGMLHMRSNQSLYLAPGATLLGSDVYADYVRLPGEGSSSEKYLLGSWYAEGLKVYGRGIINGNGTALRTQDPTGRGFKTHNIQFMASNNIIMDGIVSLDAGSWSVEPILCDNLHISNMKIVSDMRYYGDALLNNDGFDINRCRHVLVEDSFVWANDDAMTPKNDRNPNVLPLRDMYDITFRNMIVYTRKCAFKLGSETDNENYRIYDMLVENVDVVFADRSIAIWSDGGALIEDITFKDIRIEETSTEYKQNHINFRIDTPGNSVKNVRIINLSADEPAPKGSVFEGTNLGAIINGETVQYYGIYFENYTIGGLPVLSLDDERANFHLDNDAVPADASAFIFALDLPLRDISMYVEYDEELAEIGIGVDGESLMGNPAVFSGLEESEDHVVEFGPAPASGLAQ